MLSFTSDERRNSTITVYNRRFECTRLERIADKTELFYNYRFKEK